jgi:signal transduction histidine kinase
MVVLLFTVTATVSMITFTMAKFFHADKQAYVNDWVSIAAVTTADDASSVLLSYARRLQSYTRILLSRDVPLEEKNTLIAGFFEDLPELVNLTVYADGEMAQTAGDRRALERAGLAPDVAVFETGQEPLPLERILEGEVYLRNSTHAEEQPWFTLAFSGSDPDGEPVVVAALLRPDELQRVGSKFKVFEVLLTDPEGFYLAHPDPGKVARRERAELHDAARAVHGEHEISRTALFSQNGREMLGGFAAVPYGGLTAVTQVPRSAAYLATRDLLIRMLWVTLLVLVVAAVAGRLWSRRVTRPVERLASATRRIAKGDFDFQVEVESRDEIGGLAGSFNQMASELDTREKALKEAQAQLLQSEKMAAFGQLGAGIAHEVKNPLTGILGCAQLAMLEVEEGSRMQANLEIIEKESERCKTIIENLLKFARHEKTKLEITDVNRVIRDAAAIVNHQLEMNQVHLEVELQGDLPPVKANGNQLQQVIMNLMINAQQAMDGEPGQVTVASTCPDDGNIQISVRDTGPGMPEEVRTKIFEPFFTTKEAGKGTGLGLSVSYGIVRDHEGEIEVRSEPGEGAEFVIRLPATNGETAPESVMIG